MGKTFETKAGFTLIETLVAVSVLLVAVVAPLTIASRSISYTNFARDQVIASYLAFDALETIIAKRDYNVANDLDWDTGINVVGEDGDCSGNLDPENGAQHYCQIDTAGDISGIALRNCLEHSTNENFYPTVVCDDLDFFDDGSYGHDINRSEDGDGTSFKRIIEIENINSDEILVTSRVKFKTGLLTKEFSINLNLFNTGI